MAKNCLVLLTDGNENIGDANGAVAWPRNTSSERRPVVPREGGGGGLGVKPSGTMFCRSSELQVPPN